MHPHNPHQERYDLPLLCETTPSLKQYLKKNPSGEDTIDFANPAAVLVLNQALLAHHYKIKNWSIPSQALCPAIPGRADYLYHLNDLLNEKPSRFSKRSNTIRILDIGCGANLIYPLIGASTWGWHFLACDSHVGAIENAMHLIEDNPKLKSKIKVAFQQHSGKIFKGILRGQFDATLCNPPFHSSPDEALKAHQLKNKGLGQNKKSSQKTNLNFGGESHELWCEGGEKAFVSRMIQESAGFKKQVRWFTTLVSKQDHLNLFQKLLENSEAKQVRVIPMAQGQKKSRILAWSFIEKAPRGSRPGLNNVASPRLSD